ncbi:hypothetical protein J1614_004533 [Plenodomus biglobosus]|nr:hypothetical protein J1614_004533 [Plenodomus biglobosus]
MAADLRLLSLDGGGVRGLASLYMLNKILSYVGSPKPCDYFDMICGTSTGGLIAIMLGRLEMSVKECIDAYIEIMDVVFDPKDKKKLPFKLRNGKVQPRYETKRLESVIKQIISKASHPSDALFRGTKDSKCKTVVVALAEEASSPSRFTDYRKTGEYSEFYNEVKIWEVARATSAATSFFEPIKIIAAGEPRVFVDGGVGFNNPVNELYDEASTQLIKADQDLDDHIRVLVSLGTGKPALRGFGSKVTEVAESIIKMASETQHTADTFDRAHRRLVERDGYFRFNPPDLNEVALDEASKKGIIAARCDAFGSSPETERMAKRWTKVAGNEQIIVPRSASPSTLVEETRTKLFYTLHKSPKYIKEPVTSYWQHLTLDSYYVFEKIYDECEKANGKVTLRSFFLQFGAADRPTPREVAEVWTRLLRDKSDIRNSLHRKPFVMAVLYMLHIEKHLEISKMVDVDPDRRETLKRFAKWVPCQCKCGRQWNFVNEVGLSRSGDSRRECELSKLFDCSSWMLVFRGDQVRKLEATRQLWEAIV